MSFELKFSLVRGDTNQGGGEMSFGLKFSVVREDTNQGSGASYYLTSVFSGYELLLLNN